MRWISKCDGYQKVVASRFYKFFEHGQRPLQNQFAGSAVKNENMANQELVEELHKLIIRIFQKWKVYLSLIDNICGTDLANMQLISAFNEGI